jgi:hypothetical protein
MAKSSAWTDWYSRNREGYLAEKRRRYRKSPKDRREAIQRATRSQDERGKYWGRLRPAIPPKTMEVEAGGKTSPRLMFSVAHLAQSLRRQPQIVRYWEEHGAIPPTPYRVARGGREYRFYTAEMVDAVVAAAGKSVNGGTLDSDTRVAMHNGIAEAWRHLGVPHREGGGRR